jgi:hypothetical protein
MAEPKTQKNDGDVGAFLASIEDPVRRADAEALDALLTKVTKSGPVMYGDSIVGYGEHLITYAGGEQRPWMVLGFAPRKSNTTLYLTGRADDYADILGRLGKHTAKGGCVHITKLSDVDQSVLVELLKASFSNR